MLSTCKMFILNFSLQSRLEDRLEAIRPIRKSTRPEDQPIFTSPTGMDLEKRRIIVPPGFIDLAVLQGGDEYVKAEDVVTIINAILEMVMPVLNNIETHLAEGSGEELSKEESE